MPFFVLFHSPGPAWQEGVPYRDQKGLGEHLAFARGLYDEGRLVFGGPFLDADSGGMLVIRADSLAEARTVANRDPSIGGLLHVAVRPWAVGMSTVDIPE